VTYAPRNRVWSAVAATGPCVTGPEMLAHLRLPDSSEAALVDGYTMAAQGMIERRIQRLLSRRTATLRLPGLPSGDCPVELPGGEIGAITSMTADGAAVTGTTFAGDSPALLRPATNWPIVTGQGYPVVIIYTVGFLTVPADLRAAVMLLAAELFERRANGTEGTMSEVPVSAQALMETWRIRPV
jgi:uncharacterized phiE125 gp8 family phage protein